MVIISQLSLLPIPSITLKKDNEQGVVTMAVRHAEKRRSSTCRFADRVAALSVQHYRTVVPESFRLAQRQTCLATIVAKIDKDDNSRRSELVVLGLGVGTKFLSESTLNRMASPSSCSSSSNDEHDYGDRVRDCHAEVLARRAFRRHLSLEILRDLHHPSHQSSLSPSHRDTTATLLERVTPPPTTTATATTPVHPEQSIDGANDASLSSSSAQRLLPFYYRLRDRVTLHFYCSSAPCGNAVLKRFATCQKETFRDKYTDEEWPQERHYENFGHSQPLGEFALLCKKDNTAATTSTNTSATASIDDDHHSSDNYSKSRFLPTPRTISTGKKEARWPCHASDAWCPPGTTTVFTQKGSLHTCSDKLARWNYLGLQGSLLASCFMMTDLGQQQLCPQPLYMSTLIVGRKFTAVTCRRAVCCRLQDKSTMNKKHKKDNDMDTSATTSTTASHSGSKGDKPPRSNVSMTSKDTCSSSLYHVNHPAVLGTGVYMDEHGVIDMTLSSSSSSTRTTADASPTTTATKGGGGYGRDVRFHSTQSWAWWPGLDVAECIDGSTGFLFLRGVGENDEERPSSSALTSPITTSTTMTAANAPLHQQHCRRSRVSLVSTSALVALFNEIRTTATCCSRREQDANSNNNNREVDGQGKSKNASCNLSGDDKQLQASELSRPVRLAPDTTTATSSPCRTLTGLRSFKRKHSPEYERVKQVLLDQHSVFRHWKRRQFVKLNSCPSSQHDDD